MNEPIFHHEKLDFYRLSIDDKNRTGKSQLRQIVAMLTKLLARNESVSEASSFYRAIFEHEHEHEEEPEPSDATETSRSCRDY